MGLLNAVVIFSAAAALPFVNGLDETTYPFEAPSSSAARSPCPGLNALANHGILPRDGKNIDLATLQTAAYTGFSLASAATLLVGSTALSTSTTGNSSTFHLSDLAQHDPQVIEHDGSMTRNDAYFGDNHSFNKEAWARTQANWGDNDTISFAVAAAERKARFVYGAANNPNFNATFANSLTLLEYGLILSVFGDATEGNGNVSLITYMFENERLPIELGWQPPTSNITVSTVRTLAASVAAEL